ncbi:MAG: substrate-binding domain-containing protein [Chloroflexi bacterium]|nr:substrate-binding domain-containing protein [Chloroflexota bacterium]
MSNGGKKISILDIAQVANVSPSTVSRVLRGSAGVTPAKHAAVLQAVAALDYRPNIFAQSLASGQSMTIGVLTQNFGSAFYDGILRGILQGLDGTDYWPIFADGRWQPQVEAQALQLLLDRQVDGVILVGGQIPEERLREVAAHTPLLVVGRELSTLPDHCLYVKNFAAAYQLTRYLLDMGHREIATITASVGYESTVNDVLKRHQGYLQALDDAGIEPDPALVVEGNLLQQSGVLAVEMLLSRGRPFSAIFAANDNMASGARLALFRRGIRVPEDVSLVGFDDQATSAYMIPPLTTVRQPAIELGHAAAQAILAFINGQTPTLTPFDTELIIRESVARHR